MGFVRMAGFLDFIGIVMAAVAIGALGGLW